MSSPRRPTAGSAWPAQVLLIITVSAGLLLMHANIAAGTPGHRAGSASMAGTVTMTASTAQDSPIRPVVALPSPLQPGMPESASMADCLLLLVLVVLALLAQRRPASDTRTSWWRPTTPAPRGSPCFSSVPSSLVLRI